MRKPIALALLAPMLFACGGGDSYDSIEDVAEAANCTGLNVDGSEDRTMFATESGYCEHMGEQQRVNWFKGGGDGLDAFEEVAQGMGGSYVLYGSNWAIECSDKIPCDSMQESVGGEVR